MKKLKNLLISDFDSGLFEKPPGEILFLYEQAEELENKDQFMKNFESKFPDANFDVQKIEDLKKLRKKYELVVPVKAYDLSGSSRSKIEKFALLNAKYLVISEDTYGYIRLANRLNLFYRLYLRKLVTLFYIITLFFVVVVPSVVFYLLMNVFSKKANTNV